MDQNIYDNIEKEIIKYKHFGMGNRLDDVLTIAFFFLLLVDSFLIFFHPIIGGTVIIAALVCMILYVIITPYKFVKNYFKNENNRKIIQSLIEENSKSNDTAKKILDKFDFSKPLKCNYAWHILKIDYLKRLIIKTNPSILEIIKKHGITNNDSLKEAIEHYRSRIATTKDFKFSLIPILSLIISIISIFFKDSINAIIATIISATVIIIAYSLLLWYKTTYYTQYSKKSFYKNIEQSLSSIYISNELNRPTGQYGFPTHLL